MNHEVEYTNHFYGATAAEALAQANADSIPFSNVEWSHVDVHQYDMEWTMATSEEQKWVAVLSARGRT